jgi:branched-chain amino acid transport system ATP-binding protein
MYDQSFFKKLGGPEAAEGIYGSLSTALYFGKADAAQIPAVAQIQKFYAQVFGSLSVFDNVLTAAELRRNWSSEGEDPRAVATEQLARVGLESHAHVMADAVPTGVARLVELARALALRPRLLLLDEPSSGLSEEETHAFAGLLRDVVADGGSVLIVEHDVDLVMTLCSTVHVLDVGRVICSGPPATVQADPAVQQAYLGIAEPGSLVDA